MQDKIAEDDSAFILDRTKLLQNFLEEVLMDQELRKSGIVFKFLSFNERKFELLRSQMLASQDKRTSLPKDPQPEPSIRRLSSLLNSYIYVPLTGTPPSLIPEMLEKQYQREVVSKLSDLSKTITEVSSKLHKQNELMCKKTMPLQDQVDR